MAITGIKGINDILPQGDLVAIALWSLLTGLSALWQYQPDLVRAEKYLSSALETSRRIGDHYHQMLSSTYLSTTRRFQDDPDGCQALAEKAVELSLEERAINYLGMSQGHLAWVAWRRQDYEGSFEIGTQALENLRNFPTYPFWWSAVFPLLAIHLQRHTEPSAIQELAGYLLADKQQRLPDDLNRLLEQLIDETEPAIVMGWLSQAIELADRYGYL